MNFFQDRIRQLFMKAGRTPELSESVVKHDRLDDGVMEDMIERALAFRHEMSNAPEIDLDALDPENKLTGEEREKAASYTQWEELFKDTFRALHTFRDPELLTPEQVKASHELNRRAMQQVIGSDRFQELRIDTRHDDLTSAFTAISMASKMRETFSDELAEYVRRAIEMREIEDEIENLPLPPPGEGDGDGDGDGQPGGGGGTPDPYADQREQLQNDLAEKEAEQEQAGTGQALQEAIEDAMDEAEDAANAVASMPGSGSGEERQLPPDKFIELAQQYRENPILRRVAEMTGRLQRSISSARAKRVVGGREEVVDVTVGNDLPLVLPGELALAGIPATRIEFARRYAQRRLLQFETVGTEDAGMGPLCISLDGSSSMSGHRNEWARALALALVTIAKREGRDAMIVEFDGMRTQTWEFLARQPIDPEKTLEFVTHFFAGGTDNTLGLKECKRFIDTRPEFSKADLVILTDGEDNYREDDIALREEFTERGIRVHGVSIGYPAENNRYLGEMADTVVTANDMLQPSAATDQLAQNIT